MWSLWCRLQLGSGRPSTPPTAVSARPLLDLVEQLSLSLTWGWRRTCQEMTWVRQVRLWLCFLFLSWWVSRLFDLLITYSFIIALVTESVCLADQAGTTAPPTTAATTTTAAPAPTPPGTPERGTYSVKNSNSTVCLLAQMGLQLNVSFFSPSQNKVKDILTTNDH